MAEVDRLQRELLSRQNGDGGWGYQNATSWTEPTALALLALEALGNAGAPHQRGCAWLLRMQRADGGWPPCLSALVSTSVTNLATLALCSSSRSLPAYSAALRWILKQIKPDLRPVARMEFWLGDLPAKEATAGGSPWFPGTAAWIAPTATAVLALSEAAEYGQVKRGQEYILSRRCLDGGWNHGGTQYRGKEAASYPEMTGMALVALEGMSSPELAGSFQVAERLQQSPGSSEAQSWLHLAMVRHGRDSTALDAPLPWHTNRDLALRLLALTAASPANRMRLKAA